MDKVFTRAVDDAARRLVSASHQPDSSVIATSSVYPSGAPVTIRVSFDGNSCVVTDAGLAALEAELMGASNRMFSGQGRTVARQFGIGFDNHSFFIAQTSVDKLQGAVKIVAAASHKAAVLTETRMSEQSERNDREYLVDRLIEVFGRTNVEKDIEVQGASTHRWPITSRVREGNIHILFDCAGPSHVSVFSTHTKFADISRLENAPDGVIAVSRLEGFKRDYQSLLRQAGKLIEISANDEAYRSLARVA